MTSHLGNIRKLITSSNEYIAFRKCINSNIKSKYKNSNVHPPPPGVIFINGYRSEMQNSKKANYIGESCERLGINFLTYDHYACGLSTGSILKGTIGRWYGDLCLLIEKETNGPQVLVGSSMGAWLALLVVLRNEKLRNRIHGIIGVAPGINFTELLWNEVLELGLVKDDKFNDPNDQSDHKSDETTSSETSRIEGGMQGEEPQTIYNKPSQYSPTGYYPITIQFLQESRRYFIDKQELINGIPCPIVLIHGQQDQDVPYQRTLEWAKLFSGNNEENVKVKLIPDGDHRLSKERDLKVLENEVENMCFKASSILEIETIN